MKKSIISLAIVVIILVVTYNFSPETINAVIKFFGTLGILPYLVIALVLMAIFLPRRLR